jgi:hypothetical protein
MYYLNLSKERNEKKVGASKKEERKASLVSQEDAH